MATAAFAGFEETGEGGGVGLVGGDGDEVDGGGAEEAFEFALGSGLAFLESAASGAG